MPSRKAPGIAERRHLARFLNGLVTDYVEVFERAFDALGGEPWPPGTREPFSAPLHDLFLQVSRDEGYEEILTCILAATWADLTWCTAAAKTPSSRRPIRDWVALHAGGPFADSVGWLRGEVDRRGPSLSPERQARMARLFEATLVAEIPFHDVAYEDVKVSSGV